MQSLLRRMAKKLTVCSNGKLSHAHPHFCTPHPVPIIMLSSFFPVYYAGMTHQEVMYDDKLSAAFKKVTWTLSRMLTLPRLRPDMACP